MAKILVVEDEKDLNRYVATCLRNNNYDVTVAYDGEEALTKIEENKFDLTYPYWARTKLPRNDKSLSLRPSFALKGFYLPAPKYEQIL